MIKQPWATLLILATILFIAAIGTGLGWILSPYLVSKNPASTIATIAAIFTFCFFTFAIDRVHIFQIRHFCKRHGLKVLEIKTCKNHFGVEYLENEQKLYGKWPKDFQKYEDKLS